MSFWETIFKVALPAAVTLYGAKQTQDANNKAAQQMTKATQASTNAELEGLRVAQETIKANQRAASPGLSRVQEIIGRGERLTPEQELAVEDSRRQALNTLQGSSLRGSGRATAAIVNDVDTRTRNNFMSQNRSSADSAAGNLAGQYFNSGQSLVSNAGQQGTAVSKGLSDTGTIQASNTMGQGVLRGQAIGDISALIADAAKRESQYKEPVKDA
jgi:hypothetical protein